MLTDIVGLKPGESGVVKEIISGCGFAGRIQNLGIRVGKKVKKLNAQFWRGPQVVEIDNFKVALGYGMAKKVIVEKVE